METTEVVRELSDVLTSKIVAALAGIQDQDQVGAWAEDALALTPPVERRLRFAHEVLQEIADAQGMTSAQAWALTANPRLGSDSPIKAIREDRFHEATAAAKAQLDDAYDG